MLTHRNKKPYECKAENCGKSYCDARSLRRHTENHHSSVAMAATTPNQVISSTGPLSGLSLSPATASGMFPFSFSRFFFFCVLRVHLLFLVIVVIIEWKLMNNLVLRPNKNEKCKRASVQSGY